MWTWQPKKNAAMAIITGCMNAKVTETATTDHESTNLNRLQESSMSQEIKCIEVVGDHVRFQNEVADATCHEYRISSSGIVPLNQPDSLSIKFYWAIMVRDWRP